MACLFVHTLLSFLHLVELDEFLFGNETARTDRNNEYQKGDAKALETAQSQTSAVDTAFVLFTARVPPTVLYADNLAHSSATRALAVIWSNALTFVGTALLAETDWLIASILSSVGADPAILTFVRWALAVAFIAWLALRAVTTNFGTIFAPVALLVALLR